MLVGIAADHGGFELKTQLVEKLKAAGYKVKDFGAHKFESDDDYPDMVIPLAKAVAGSEVDKGIAVCGSGVGASVAANKVKGVRAAITHDSFSAKQGVEDDDMNMICLGGRIIGIALAWVIVQNFLQAVFKKKEARLQRRLDKVLLEEEKQFRGISD
jgi:ribose 5-phosphate isomerase B